MTAFGPYADTQEIDFAKLKNKNIFLITGPTGAGKTTIFDGISYAIYGEASGEGRDGESLRSQFAKDDTLTTVELEFELKGKIYYIKRIPKQLKPKARGEGFTEQKTDAELKILGEEDSKTISGVSDVNTKINEIMGINSEQFRQIMMIPQGEFRKLLVSDSREREKILQKIFGTFGYKLVEIKLNERSKNIKRDIEILENNRIGALNRIEIEDMQVLRSKLQEKNFNIFEVLDLIRNQIEKDQLQRDNTDKLLDKYDKEISLHQQKIFQAQKNNEKFQELDVIKKEKAGLEERQEEIRQKGDSLEKGKRALTLKFSEENYNEKQSIFENKAKDLEEKNNRFKESDKELKLAEERLNLEKNREEHRDNLKKEIEKLKGYEEKIGIFEEKERIIKELEEAIGLKDKEIKVKKDDLLKSRNDLEVLSAKLESAKDAKGKYIEEKAKLERLKQQLDGLNRLYDENNYLVNLRNSYRSVQGKYNEFKSNYENHRRIYEEQLDKWYKGQAGILAKQLKENSPCPVCGSIDHPSVAQMEGGLPTEEEIKLSKDKLEELEKKFKDVERDFMEIDTQGRAKKELVNSLIDRLEADIKGEVLDKKPEDRSDILKARIEELKKDTVQIETLLKKYDMEKNQAEDIAKSIEKKAKYIKALEDEIEKISEYIKDLSQRVNMDKGILEGLSGDLPEDLRSKDKLNTLVQGLIKSYEDMVKNLRSAEEGFNKAGISHEGAKTARNLAEKSFEESSLLLEGAKDKFHSEMLKLGFESEEAYRSIKLSSEEIESLEKEINEYHQHLRSATDSLKKALKAVEGLEIINVDILENEKKDIESAKKNLLSEKTEVLSRIKRNEEEIQEVERIEDEIKAKEREYALVGKLAKIAKGDNSRGLTFERYVLASFLDDILAAANIRLKKMTGNRYEMSRTDERTRSNAQSGLELEVYDYHTGRTRHVKTLSGGESFKASLSLALGLADVVQSYAGGIRMDTMFIDEGFGTLDPESLDSAVETLIDLQNSGRLVGIISHVPELKERVSAKLEVIPGNTGSRAVFNIL